jgi:hypothetical protein
VRPAETRNGATSRQDKTKLAGAGALLAAALVLTVRGDPTPEQRWAWTTPDVKRAVEDRTMFVDPAEVVALRKDLNVFNEATGS